MKRFLLAVVLAWTTLASADVGPIIVADSGTATISVTGSSAATALPRADSLRNQVELQNNGSVVVFVRFCPTSTCTAVVATDYPILPSQSKVVSINPGSQFIATIGASAGPTTLYVSVGIGQ
jgi:hypothetical protein